MMKLLNDSGRYVMLTALLAIVPASASADLIAWLEPATQTLTVGDTGYFDVLVSGETTTPDAVLGYTITLTKQSGVGFTGVSETTSASGGYIFPTNSGIDPQPPSATEFAYLDASTSTATDVSSANVFGAGRISFNAVSAGDYTINFVETKSGFFDSGLSNFATVYTGATIHINPAAVPEPSTTLLLGLLAVVAIGVTWRRRNRPAIRTAGV